MKSEGFKSAEISVRAEKTGKKRKMEDSAVSDDFVSAYQNFVCIIKEITDENSVPYR